MNNLSYFLRRRQPQLMWAVSLPFEKTCLHISCDLELITIYLAAVLHILCLEASSAQTKPISIFILICRIKIQIHTVTIFRMISGYGLRLLDLIIIFDAKTDKTIPYSEILLNYYDRVSIWNQGLAQIIYYGTFKHIIISYLINLRWLILSTTLIFLTLFYLRHLLFFDHL